MKTNLTAFNSRLLAETMRRRRDALFAENKPLVDSKNKLTRQLAKGNLSDRRIATIRTKIAAIEAEQAPILAEIGKINRELRG